MRLSIAEIKKQAEGVVIEDMLQSIQGGSNDECHPQDLPPVGGGGVIIIIDDIY